MFYCPEYKKIFFWELLLKSGDCLVFDDLIITFVTRLSLSALKVFLSLSRFNLEEEDINL